MTNTIKQFHYKKSRIQQLKGFCYTVQEGSSRGAAKKMGLDPSSISLQIKSLEGDLGIELFERKGKKLILNEKGRKFYDLAIIQLQGIDGLFESFHEKLIDDDKNTLIIAGYYSALSYILPKYLKILLSDDRFKNLKIKLCNISISEAFERLKNGKVDFAFYPSVHNDIVPVEINKENVFKLKNAVFIHKNHPLAKKKILERKDLEKYEFLVRDKYDFLDLRKVIDFKSSQIEFENGNSHIVLGLVKENIAIGICGEVYKDENEIANKQGLSVRNIDYLLKKMFYSLFILKNKKNKSSADFLFKIFKKNSDL